MPPPSRPSLLLQPAQMARRHTFLRSFFRLGYLHSYSPSKDGVPVIHPYLKYVLSTSGQSCMPRGSSRQTADRHTPWLSAHPPSAHEEMPEAKALHTTGNNESRYANAHPRTGCRIHETAADMRSLRHRRAVPCVPSRCGHVPAYPCSKSPCVPLLSFSLPR